MKHFLKTFSFLFLSSLLLTACGSGGVGGGAGSPPTAGGGGGGGSGGGGGGGIIYGWNSSTGLGVISSASDGLLRISCPKKTSLCFAIGPGSIQKSIDSGATWTQVHAFASNNPSGSTADISFVDASNGFAMTNYKTATALFSTTDGGTTWNPVTTTLSSTVVAGLSFADLTHGVATSIQGAIYYTTDGGSSFQASTITSTVAVSSFTFTKPVFVDSTTGFSVGTFGAGAYGVLIKTTDAGKTWKNISLGITGTFYTNQVAFVDSQNGFVQVMTGSLGAESILVTTDGGTTWATHALPLGSFVGAVSLSCFDTGHCIAATVQGIYGSKDGGVTWTLQSQPTVELVESLELTSATHGVGVGYMAVVSTNPVSVTYYNFGLHTDSGGF